MWVIVTLVGLTIAGVLLLYIPLDLVLQLDVPGEPRFRGRLSWLFGLVSKEMPGGERAEKKKEVKVKRKLKGRKGRAWYILEILRAKGLFGQVRGLLKDALGRLEIRELRTDCRVGLDNPADIGLLFAFIGPATFWLNSAIPYQIRVEPSFESESVFASHSCGVVRLRPIRLVIPVLRFIFSLAALRVVKKLVRRKWSRRK